MLSATQTAAQPPIETAHGVDAETFSTLWSGDRDGSGNDSSTSPATKSGLEELAAVTDIAFTHPPEEVEQWNRGDHGEFPESDGSTSIGPAEVDRTDGVFIKDAYVAIFAVQPSTRVLQSPTEQPLYVGDDGEVLATTDYRVTVPSDDLEGNRRTYWELKDHLIESIRLLIDGDEEASLESTHRPVLKFSDLRTNPGTEHTLTVEVTIRVKFSKRVVAIEESCEVLETPFLEQGGDGVKSEEHCWTVAETTTTSPIEQLTVVDSVDVVEYAPTFTGAFAEIDESGPQVAIRGDQPWVSYTQGETTVQSHWRFYTARNPEWDRLTAETDGGKKEQTSPSQPLQVYAYPSQAGPRANSGLPVQAIGSTTESPPTLPAEIDLAVATEAYPVQPTVITQLEGELSGPILVAGIVRGADIDLSPTSLRETEVHESDLALTIEETNVESVTVTVALRDSETGAPIQTMGRPGTISLAGTHLETDERGVATATLPRPAGAVTARFEPAPWWDVNQAYHHSSDTVYVRGTSIPIVGTLFRLSLPLGAFLFAAVLIDRLTGGRFWPPWRGL